MKIKTLIVSGAALAAAIVGAPLAAAGVATSAAPAPVRGAASAVADAGVANADAAYPHQCNKWRWQRLPGPWWTNNYGWVRYCYQIPN